MTLAELQQKANAKLAQIWPVLQSREDAYFAKHGNYFGIRYSPFAPVIDGVDTTLIVEYPSRKCVQEDVQIPETDVPFQVSIERINQQEPRNIAPWVDLSQPKPTPVWGATGETYKATVRAQLPNGDIWMRSRMQDNTDTGWYQYVNTKV